jgi:hypothetical protein
MSFGGTLAVLVVASIYSNSRLTDLQKFVSELMRTDDGKHQANIRRVEVKTEANTRRVEELLLHKFAKLDDPLNRIEAKLNM